MKRIGVLTLVILLLCGCAVRQEAPLPTGEPAPPQAQPPMSLYSPESPLEQESEGAVKAYPLSLSDCGGLFPMGEDLLIISGLGRSCTLTRLCGETLSVTASAGLNTWLESEGCGLRVFPEGLSFYDREAEQTVVLGALLQEQRRLDAPQDMTGVPLLTRDGALLYYCTRDSVRCLDTQSGISKLLLQSSLDGKTLESLLLDESVLQLRYQDPQLGLRTLFLSTQTGEVLFQWEDILTLSGENSDYYASVPGDGTEYHVFGSADSQPRMLLPQLDENVFFLPRSHAAVGVKAATAQEPLTLRYYDLIQGSRACVLGIDSPYCPQYFASTGGSALYFLLYDDSFRTTVLYRWDTAGAETEEGTYTAPYQSEKDPDEAALEACAAYAQQIGQRYGIRIAIWKEAAATQPWDYTLTPEHQVYFTQLYLAQLERLLEKYPPGFLSAAAENCDGLTVCLVRSIEGSPLAPELGKADGIQYWEDNSAYIALATGPKFEQMLYHEFYHIIEIQLFSGSHALDSWEQLNPGDFEYDYDYITNQSRDGSPFLKEVSRSFIDTYSMSYPKEDRARILEYAMSDGNREVFDAPILQQKLQKLCLAIREAFGLEEYPNILPWEQYLHRPLVPEN